jgi:hypothetical protein
MAEIDYGWDIVVGKDVLKILTAIVNLIVNARIGDGAIGAERLESACADVEKMNDGVVVDPILDRGLGDHFFSYGFHCGLLSGI